ncbi:TolC family protein [Phaeobacter sp. QD34_3]|uniref:TolC family protein n=1 Tax=unclassified Phaeobacter TaxID=2621772 RepID=UPI00237F582C|nr:MULTISPECIES: TolC family protein [unclassified Phaeobacter]MDE4135061.1 TolC family protein [Phaeobacter sp. QD34_3]MDE4138691.1 TolC family protein [Phaeobacter sp. QD34_24]
MQLGRSAGVIALLCSLSACAEQSPFLVKNSDGSVSRTASSFQQAEGEASSEIISSLMQRRSLLEEGSIYRQVGEAAITASSRASEAELISAKLRAEAKSKNWLPTIGPSVSLTDLGDLVAGLLIEQILFDNGRRKAEREFAAADVEVAAVNLSIDMNTRVETAVALYSAGLRGDEKAAYLGRAIHQMSEFRRIVSGRVEGGLNDQSDLNVVDSKISGLRTAKATAADSASTARAELQAMTGQRFPDKPQRLDLGTPPQQTAFLDVMKAQAEAERTIAEAKAGRAGLLPQVAAAGNVTSDGSGAGLTVDLATPLGLGTPAALQALEASKEAARRTIGEAEEDSRRTYARQMQRLASYIRQESETASLARASRETYKLFKSQYEAGQRPVMEVVSIYEELIRREQAHIDAKYEVILIQLELSRDMGLLADGNKI